MKTQRKVIMQFSAGFLIGLILGLHIERFRPRILNVWDTKPVNVFNLLDPEPSILTLNTNTNENVRP